MSVFEYKAVTPQGEVKSGQMSGASQAEVIAKLQQTGLIPISADVLGEVTAPKGKSRRRWRRDRLGRNEVAEFTRQLSVLVGAGLPLDRALEIMRRVSENPLLSGLVGELQTSVRGGDSLSAALREHPAVFSDFYINFIQAAEYSGNLSGSLDDLSNYLEKSRTLREQLVSAIIYPAILVTVTVLSLLIIVVWVLPEFSQLFADMDAALPASAAFVLGVSDAIRQYGLFALAAIILLVLYFRRQYRDPAWRYGWDARLLNAPLLGDLTKKVNMARLSRSLGTLLRGGVPLLAALKIARNSLQNRVLATRLEEITGNVQEGSDLAGPLIATGVFPEFALQMIQVGEETGQLDEMLIRVADIYDDEVATATRRLLSVLEPALIIGLGILIGGIIMSILVAILSINELPM